MEFLRMGDHGAYVWPAYGVVTAVMAGILIQTLKKLRSTEKALNALRGEDEETLDDETET